MKQYIKDKLAAGATMEEIAAEFSNSLNEATKENEANTERKETLRSICNSLIDYVNKYHNQSMEYLSDEEIDKVDEALPVLISLSEAMENFSSSISVLSTPEVNELTFSTNSTTAKPKSLEKLLNEDNIIRAYVDSLFKL